MAPNNVQDDEHPNLAMQIKMRFIVFLSGASSRYTVYAWITRKRRTSQRSLLATNFHPREYWMKVRTSKLWTKWKNSAYSLCGHVFPFLFYFHTMTILRSRGSKRLKGLSILNPRYYCSLFEEYTHTKLAPTTRKMDYGFLCFEQKNHSSWMTCWLLHFDKLFCKSHSRQFTTQWAVLSLFMDIRAIFTISVTFQHLLKTIMYSWIAWESVKLSESH